MSEPLDYPDNPPASTWGGKAKRIVASVPAVVEQPVNSEGGPFVSARVVDARCGSCGHALVLFRTPCPSRITGYLETYRCPDCATTEPKATCAKCGEPRHIVPADKFECAETPALADRVARAIDDSLHAYKTQGDYRAAALAAMAAMPRPSREQIARLIVDNYTHEKDIRRGDLRVADAVLSLFSEDAP